VIRAAGHAHAQTEVDLPLRREAQINRGEDLLLIPQGGADLSGVNLEGANLREARARSVHQICCAMDRRGALLDESLLQQVDSQYGTIR